MTYKFMCGCVCDNDIYAHVCGNAQLNKFYN